MFWRKIPYAVYFIGFSGILMLVPLIHALMHEDWRVARAFLYAALTMGFLFTTFTIALEGRELRLTGPQNLAMILLSFLLLPVLLAVPMVLGLPWLGFSAAYFEMCAALTTTGATLFEFPQEVPDSIHLWRGLVGWSGGALILFVAVAIMSPLNLGGFEVRTVVSGSPAGAHGPSIGGMIPPERFRRAAFRVLPIYFALSVALGLGLLMSGEPPLRAAILAMSTLSTSGITPDGLPPSSNMAQLLVLGLLLLTATHILYEKRTTFRRTLWQDEPELRVVAVLLLIIPIVITLRHWLFDTGTEDALVPNEMLRAFWAALFTIGSFLTTTGFLSPDWHLVEHWSGWRDAGLLLLGFSAIGGGVATTAGGAKLLRVWAVFNMGFREIDKMTHPQSVAGSGVNMRRIRRQGTSVAWIFVMLFLMAISTSMLVFAAMGIEFTETIWLSVAALSNTGPLLGTLSDSTLSYADLDAAPRWFFCAAMIVGRVEVLAIVALMTPEYWRR